MFETLENRRLMHSAFSASINMQPLAAPRAPGFLTDYGVTYGVRRGGLSYGWATDAQANAVDRNLTKIQKNDTYIAMQAGGVNNTWEIGVENGLYNVYLVGGDPAVTGDRMAITVEGQVAVSGVTKPARRYIEGLVTVNVTDGRLSVGNASWAVNNKLCYLAVVSTEDGSHANIGQLSIASTMPTASESGTAGHFTLTRTGSTASAVTVPISVSGTATNGTDYGVFGSAVTFQPGEATIDLPVNAIDDSDVEGNETVVVTLGAVNQYTVTPATATVTITDNDTTSPATTLQWSSAAAATQAKSEAFGIGVGGKLYMFGGYVDSTFVPSRAAYAYTKATNSWSAIAQLPVGTTQAGVTADSRYIYFAGGYQALTKGQNFAPTSVYAYDTQNNTYAALPSLPQGRGPGGLALVGRKLYFIGGSNASRVDVSTVWALDLDNQAAGWVTRASLPAARNRFGATVLNGKIYVVGGQTSYDNNAVFSSQVDRYDPNTNTWTTVAALPKALSHNNASVFAVNGRIYTVAGQGSSLAPLANVYAYDPTAGTWSSQTNLPAARFSGVAGLIDGQVVFSGGYNSAFKNSTYIGRFV